MRPVDGITAKEAARILGCSPTTVSRHIADGRLTRERHAHRGLSRSQVEQLAVSTYRWRKHLDDATSYWVTAAAAADILDMSTSRLDQLAATDRMPYLTTPAGVRLYRREQIEVLARAWCPATSSS
jgi:hypothetical protein